ncbi:MAG: DUF1349 domain-containing protein [Clostridium sp.]
MFSDMKWLNEPKIWVLENNILTVETDKDTDFWMETFYGFKRDNGHFYYKEVAGDFVAETTFSGDYKSLYDQGGLMIMVDNKSWIKAGIEFTDDEIHLSTVVTRNFSDWSMLTMTNFKNPLRLRIAKNGDALRVQYMNEKGKWELIRLCYLNMAEGCKVGVYTCSPQRGGFKISFENFSILEPLSMILHE